MPLGHALAMMPLASHQWQVTAGTPCIHSRAVVDMLTFLTNTQYLTADDHTHWVHTQSTGKSESREFCPGKQASLQHRTLSTLAS